MPSGWITFWDGPHPIYVSGEHETAHFRHIAEDIRRYAPPGGVMLDFGCGEALSAEIVAEPLARLILCEAAPQVRERLQARYRDHGKITVCDADALNAMADRSLDAVVMHSVSQYLSRSELIVLLQRFNRVLKPGALLVVGDVIPPSLSALADATALLRFGWRDGFFPAAVTGLIRTALSDYRTLRRSLGLTRYDSAEITQVLEQSGFTVNAAPANIGHNKQRMTFLAHARHDS